MPESTATVRCASGALRAQRRQRRRGEHQVADPLELEREDLQSARAVRYASSSRSRKCPQVNCRTTRSRPASPSRRASSRSPCSFSSAAASASGSRRRDDEAIHPVVHHVAGFARGDLRQRAGRGLIGRLRAAFAARRERRARPPRDRPPRRAARSRARCTVAARRRAQFRLDLRMRLRPPARAPRPAASGGATPRARWCTPLRRISAPTKTARKISGGSGAGVNRSVSTPRWWRKSFSCGHAGGEKRLLRFFGEHQQQRRKIVLLQHLLPRHQQPIFPALPAAQRRPIDLRRASGAVGFAFPLWRCQVGISSTLGHARAAEPRGACAPTSPDQPWKKIIPAAASSRAAAASSACFFAP